MLISDLVLEDGPIGLFHGTRSGNLESIQRHGLQPGLEARPLAHRFAQAAWDRLALDAGIGLEDLSADLIGIHPMLSGELARTNAVALGNSIRMATKVFDYGGVAFASTRFAADGYAQDGSESCAAALALARFLEHHHPHIHDTVARDLNTDGAIQNLFQEANQRDRDGVVFRLRALPEEGFFFYPGFREEPVTELTESYPGSESFYFAELLFSRPVPMHCLEIVK